MTRSTLQRIIRVDLHLFPYKIQLTQRLLPVDKPRRLEWAQRVIEMAEDAEQFWNKIIMSDEAHFTLNGTVNKQNCRIYMIYQNVYGNTYMYMEIYRKYVDNLLKINRNM